MSELIHLRADFWALEISADVYECYILDSANGKPNQGLFWKSLETESPPWIVLPPGSYRLIGIYPGMEEQTAKEFVEWEYDSDTEGEPPYAIEHRWENFFNYKDDEYNEEVTTALESVASLFASKSLTGRYAVIKKV